MKPILFNTDMVRAILDGRKTVTRRVVKTKHKDACGFYVVTRKSDGAFMGVYEYDENESMFDNPLEPPYKVNDVLYVRETWRELIRPIGTSKEYNYKADIDKWAVGLFRWKPAIHMPKQAARLFLRVTGVRVERLQDITLKECHKEGINIATDSIIDGENIARHHDFSLERFEALWDSTIKKDQLNTYGWNGNPYVWVIEFEVITADQARGD